MSVMSPPGQRVARDAPPVVSRASGGRKAYRRRRRRPAPRAPARRARQDARLEREPPRRPTTGLREPSPGHHARASSATNRPTVVNAAFRRRREAPSPALFRSAPQGPVAHAEWQGMDGRMSGRRAARRTGRRSALRARSVGSPRAHLVPRRPAGAPPSALRAFVQGRLADLVTTASPSTVPTLRQSVRSVAPAVPIATFLHSSRCDEERSRNRSASASRHACCSPVRVPWAEPVVGRRQGSLPVARPRRSIPTLALASGSLRDHLPRAHRAPPLVRSRRGRRAARASLWAYPQRRRQ